MKVKNDFPDADKTLSKLRNYVKTLQQRKKSTINDDERELCEDGIKYAEKFISAVARYLDSVCNGDDRIQREKQRNDNISEVQEFIANEDKVRTNNHSAVISSMIMIDRFAVISGMNKVFDYAGEFEREFSKLTPSSPEEKSRMSEEARIKRREMGNFGLYIGATVTAGMTRDIMITDEEAREFANCESDDFNLSEFNQEILRKVKDSSNSAKRNMEAIIE